MAMRNMTQDDINNLPEEFTGNNWPKDIKTPKTYVNEAVQKWGIKVIYEKMSCEKGGPFLYKLIVGLGHFKNEYMPSCRSPTLKIAEQNAALKFVLSPPKWLIDIVDGKEPELPPSSIPNSTKPELVVEEGIKVKEIKEKPDPQMTEDEINKLVEEIRNPDIFTGDIPEMPDCDNQDELSKNVPNFSFDSFLQEKNTEPNKFVDIFGDGHLIMKVLKEGEAYPDTAASVKIHFVGRRRSDGNIFESTLASNRPYEFKLNTGEALGVFDWAVSNMKYNEEILVMSSYVYAYGEIGHPPLFQPKESLLLWIKLVDAKAWTPTTEETELINSMTAEKRLENARKMKEVGNKFWNRRIWKLAVDQYWHAIRLLKYNKKEVWRKLDKPVRIQIKTLRANLFRNISAFYIETEEWKEAIETCDKVLEIEKDCVVSLARKSRADAELENFEQSRAAYLRAIELDRDQTHIAALKKTKLRYDEKFATYKEKSQKLEQAFGKAILSK